MSKKENGTNTTEKVRFQDCARAGVELPKAERLNETSYQSQMEHSKTQDTQRELYKSGKLPDEIQKALNNGELFTDSTFEPVDLLLENGTIVSFDSNLERFKALNQQKAERAGHLKNMLKWYPETEKVISDCLDKLNKIAKEDEQGHFFESWTTTEKDEKGNLYSVDCEGFIEFSIIGKRTSNYKTMNRTLISANKKGVEKSKADE